MMRLRRRLPQTRKTEPIVFWWALRAILAQGFLAPYRRDYWRFLRDVWRWDRTRLIDAMRHAGPGHHFLLFTRRVVRPRLEAALRESGHDETLAAPALAARGGDAVGVSASA
jgi:hypothetical protein